MMLRREFPGRPEMQVSHETIYQSVYVQGAGRCGGSWLLPAHGRALRKPRRKDGGAAGKNPGQGDDQLSGRPRSRTGGARHWEGDHDAGTRSRSTIGPAGGAEVRPGSCC
jgi:IS30 family transposase